MLTDADRRTLTNVSRLVRSLGDTPLAANFDALVERLSLPLGDQKVLAFARGQYAMTATPETLDLLRRVEEAEDRAMATAAKITDLDDARWIAMIRSRADIARDQYEEEIATMRRASRTMPAPVEFAYTGEDGG